MYAELLALALLTAQPVPPDPAPSDQASNPELRVEVRSVPREQRQPVAFERAKGLILFKANISGREVWALLDNGASRSMIDLALARELAVDPQPAGTGYTSTGQFVVHRTGPLVFSVPGQLDLHASAFAAADLTSVSAILGRKVEAVLGVELLLQAALMIDFSRQRFGFVPSGPVAADNAPTWSNLPVTLIERRAVIEASISGKPVQLEFDLGHAGGPSLQPEAWRRLGLPERSVRGGTTQGADGQVYATRLVQVDELAVGLATTRDVFVSIKPWFGDVDGVIGLASIPAAAMRIDLPAGKLLFRPSAPPAAAAEP